MTPDELRKIREAVELAYVEAKVQVAIHEDCDDSCPGKPSAQADLALVRDALDLIDRELAKE